MVNIRIIKKSQNPNTKSSSIPQNTINAMCILVPTHKSKNVINLSRSSNDQSRGDKHPKSSNIQEIHNKPLKLRVNSTNIILITETRIAKQQRKRFSKHNDSKCSLQHTLT